LPFAASSLLPLPALSCCSNDALDLTGLNMLLLISLFRLLSSLRRLGPRDMTSVAMRTRRVKVSQLRRRDRGSAFCENERSRDARDYPGDSFKTVKGVAAILDAPVGAEGGATTRRAGDLRELDDQSARGDEELEL